jgi:transcriptional regulator with XRE-family HTH domain
MKQNKLLEPPFDKDIEEKIHIQIGKNVKKLREKHGLTQLELAQELGFKSVSIISQGEIYKNRQHFNIIHLAKIACVLGEPIEKFFEGVDKILNGKCNKIDKKL